MVRPGYVQSLLDESLTSRRYATYRFIRFDKGRFGRGDCTTQRADGGAAEPARVRGRVRGPVQLPDRDRARRPGRRAGPAGRAAVRSGRGVGRLERVASLTRGQHALVLLPVDLLHEGV